MSQAIQNKIPLLFTANVSNILITYNATPKYLHNIMQLCPSLQHWPRQHPPWKGPIYLRHQVGNITNSIITSFNKCIHSTYIVSLNLQSPYLSLRGGLITTQNVVSSIGSNQPSTPHSRVWDVR